MTTTGKQLVNPGKLTSQATKLRKPRSSYFRGAKDLQDRLDQYFEQYTEETGIYPNYAGLALHLGFQSEAEMVEWAGKLRTKFRPLIKRAWAKVHELVCAGCLKANIGCIAYLKFKSGSPLIGGAIYMDKSTLEIEAPSGLSAQDQDRLRKVSDLWERERRKEIAGKVQELKVANSKRE